MTKRLLIGLNILLAIPALGFGDEGPLFNNQPIRFWMNALQSENSVARVNAANVLGQIGPPARRAADILIRALDDKSIDVRIAAIYALGLIGPGAAQSAPNLGRL